MPLQESTVESQNEILDDLLKTIQALVANPHDEVCEEEWENVKSGEFIAVREVVLKSPKILDGLGPENYGLIHYAVLHGELDTVKYIVSLCGDVNLCDGAGRTALDLCDKCPEEVRCDMTLFLTQKGGKRRNLTPCLAEETEYSSFTDVGMTSGHKDFDVLEPVVMSPSSETFSVPNRTFSDDDYSGEVLDIPTLPTTTVTFVDPNTGNQLTFLNNDGQMRYEIGGKQRPPFKVLQFSPYPPHIMFPDIGMCATLPTDTQKLQQILGGIRGMAETASVKHDIAMKIKLKKETTHWRSDTTNLVIVAVIPDGKGKIFITQRLCRWLNWKGIRSRIFHSSNDRSAVTTMLSFLKDNPGSAGILSATKCTAEARQTLLTRLQQHPNIIAKERILFIDSTDPMLPTEHPRNYEPLAEETENDLSWVQLSTSKAHGGLGGLVSINRVAAHLSQKLLFFLLNLNPAATPTYLVRTGESQHQVENRLGGDSRLTGVGWQHAAAVRRFFNLPEHSHKNMQVFSSTNSRAVETQSCFQGKRFNTFQYKSLNEINAAECDGLRPEEIKKRFPQVWTKRQKDKYHYGWPNGESYQNLNQRLEQVILDIHQSEKPVLVIGHLDICRGLFAYLSELLPELCVYLTIPQKTVFEFQYDPEKHIVDITAHDLTNDILKAGELGINHANRPSQEYLKSTPELPEKVPVPSIPPNVRDIARPSHSKSLSTESFELDHNHRSHPNSPEKNNSQ